MIEPQYKSENVELYLSDCRDVLAQLDDNSIDSVVTDPPAGISFMGKDWDTDKGGRDAWVEWMTNVMKDVHRVLKPGGHAVVWGLPRTSHWTAWALEDAGFEIRDCVYHIFGSGFPKSTSVSKQLDKMAGVERQVLRQEPHGKGSYSQGMSKSTGFRPYIAGLPSENNGGTHPITVPATEAAKEWDGWGTALKPAVECWWLCRKPLSEKTVAANVLKWGTGALNIDGCRIKHNDPAKFTERTAPRYSGRTMANGQRGGSQPVVASADPLGRWPANVILDDSEEVVSLFPQSAGQQANVKGTEPSYTGQNGIYGKFARTTANPMRGDSGSAARFFYCAKASRSERNVGLEGMPLLTNTHFGHGNNETDSFTAAHQPKMQNFHPCVKPLALMQYLIRLVTPPNGLVGDFFLGSGTTGVAALEEGFRFIGCDDNEHYLEIACKRISNVTQQTRMFL